MKLIKLVNQNYATRNSTKWSLNVANVLPKCDNPVLCTHTVLHAYRSINLALLLNPVHANIAHPRILEVEGDVVIEDFGKVGCFKQTPIRELELPEWYLDINTRKRIQIRFAILCAEAVLKIFEDKYPNDSRPRKAIEIAKIYLSTNAAAAAHAAYAADVAAHAAAAHAAAHAAYAASHAAYAAHAAAAAAHAAAADAAYAAYAAAYAADADADAIIFVDLADKAVKGESVE